MSSLFADSGSTKTDWCLLSFGGKRSSFRTDGMNPQLQTDDELQSVCDQLPELTDVSQVMFYGAGCTPALCGRMEALLRSRFPSARIYVQSDLVGAGQALCGRAMGIACIMGTGSNSCLFDGYKIVRTVSPLGYVLGDEGSGNAIGRMFLKRLLREQLPAELHDAFFREFCTTPAEIMDQIYKQPMPNRYLASVVPFVDRYKNHPAMRQLLMDVFQPFFQLLASTYSRRWPVHFTGSVAWLFRDEVTRAAREAGFRCGTFVRSPLEGIVNYNVYPTLYAPKPRRKDY